MPTTVDAGTLISVDQLIDKSIFAAKDVGLYRSLGFYYQKKPPVYTAKAGENIGVFYSWLTGANYGFPTDLWFMYYDQNNVAYYTLYKKGNYSLTKLLEQGTKTVKDQVAEEKAKKEDEDKPWYDQVLDRLKLSDDTKKTIRTVVYGLIAIKTVQLLKNK